MKVIFRVDASQQIGSGHVMRCLTLAEALRELGQTVEFITRSHPGNLDEYINSKNFKIHSLAASSDSDIQQSLVGYEQWLGVRLEVDAEESIQTLSGTRVDWLIIDHYALEQTWEQKLRPHARKIMVIDDLANRRHDCDLLLDQNYIHDSNRYDLLTFPVTTKLLGTDYVLLRKDFAENRHSTVRKHETINGIFVFFGGTDPDNLTSTALKALIQPDLKHLSVDVVIGSANPYSAQVEALVIEHPNARLHVQVENIAELMGKSNIALGAGGTTTWERMAAGLPSIVVTIAENQVAFIRDLDQDGYLRWLGNASQVDMQKIHDALLDAIQNPHKLYDQSREGQKLVDGMGAQTIAKLLSAGPDAGTLTVRRAKTSDCLLYWYWANDTMVRENAFNQQAIGWEDYESWFEKQLHDPETILLLIECDVGRIGQVRFDCSDEHLMIGYSIAKQFRGFGLCKSMAKKAVDYLRQEKLSILVDDVKECSSGKKEVFEQIDFCESTLTYHAEGTTLFSITILSNYKTWMNPWINELLAEWAMFGHRICWVHRSSEVPRGDFCFMLSCDEIVTADVLVRNKHNLVVHASNLPKGKGMSPLSWQILEGKNEIPVTLFEAEVTLDSGDIYLQESIVFEGHELLDELQVLLADTTIRLCKQYISQYPDVLEGARVQEGNESFYVKRSPIDSMLDPNKSLKDQFQLLRIVDNERYPAFFELNGKTYILKIEKSEEKIR